MLSDGGVFTRIATRNLIGNLLLFFPFGLYLPFFMQRMRKLRFFVLTVAGLIIIIEILQCLTRSGSMDIDDLILNLTGALIGFLLFNHTPIRALFKYRAY